MLVLESAFSRSKLAILTAPCGGDFWSSHVMLNSLKNWTRVCSKRVSNGQKIELFKNVAKWSKLRLFKNQKLDGHERKTAIHIKDLPKMTKTALRVKKLTKNVRIVDFEICCVFWELKKNDDNWKNCQPIYGHNSSQFWQIVLLDTAIKCEIGSIYDL